MQRRLVIMSGIIISTILNAYPGYPVPYPKPRSKAPIVGGILVLISGIVSVLDGIHIIATHSEDPIFGDIAMTCGTMMLIFGVIALLGGIIAIQRKNWGIALVGGVFALLSLAGPFLMSSILGLIGLILIATSKNDFEGFYTPQVSPGYFPQQPQKSYQMSDDDELVPIEEEKKVLKIQKCPKCGGDIKITTRERPITVKCSSCGKGFTLKGKL